MTTIVIPVSDTTVPGSTLPGEDVPLHLPVSTLLNFTRGDVLSVEVSIYRIASDGSRQHVTDRDGTTIQNIEVTDTIQRTGSTPTVYQFTYKSKEDQTTDLYFAEWIVELDGEGDQNVTNRFRLDTFRTDIKGDVEFEQPQSPAT